MIAGLVGRVLRALAVLRSGEAARALDHVGREALRLEERRRQRRATSR